MCRAVLLALALLLSACASHDYSELPMPAGEWVPANADMGTVAAPHLGWTGAQR